MPENDSLTKFGQIKLSNNNENVNIKAGFDNRRNRRARFVSGQY